MLRENPRRVPKLPALFAEIVRHDAETRGQRTEVPSMVGFAARRKRRRELSASAAAALRPAIRFDARV